MTDLLDSGANVNERDDQGETSLHHAARWGRGDEAKLLLDRGADSNAKDKTGEWEWQLSYMSTHSAVMLLRFVLS